jgi:protease II
MDTQEKTLMKEQEVLGVFNKEDYQTERLLQLRVMAYRYLFRLFIKKDSKKMVRNLCCNTRMARMAILLTHISRLHV